MFVPNIAPSTVGFVKLLEAFRPSGGTAPGAVLGGLLADREAAQLGRLSSLVRSGEIFGFDWRDGTWIPMFQFDADDRSISSEPQAVRALLPVVWTGWTVATWFSLPDERLGGGRPVDVLASDPGAVLRCARYPLAAVAGDLHGRQRDDEVALHA